MAITEGFRQQFSDNINRVLQQEGSILRKLVRNETMQHEVEYFDTIQSSEAFIRAQTVADGVNRYDITNQIGGGAGDYAFREPNMVRRQLSAQQIFWHTMFDSGNNLNTLLQPQSFQIKDAVWAMGRQYDRIIINALTSKVKTGRTGAGNENFIDTGNIIPVGVTLTVGTNVPVAMNIVDPLLGVPATANEAAAILAKSPSVHTKVQYGKLTLAKLMKARELLRRNSFDARQKLYFVCTSSQISDLLHDPKITSVDYNAVKTLVSGDVTSFMGFEFIVSELLPLIRPLFNAANNPSQYSIRDNYAFSENSIIFSRVKGAFKANADRLPQNMDNILVKAIDSVGAVRMDSKDVVCVKVLENYRTDHALLTHNQAANVNGRNALHVSSTPAGLYPVVATDALGDDAWDPTADVGFGNNHATYTNIMNDVAEKHRA